MLETDDAEVVIVRRADYDRRSADRDGGAEPDAGWRIVGVKDLLAGRVISAG